MRAALMVAKEALLAGILAETQRGITKKEEEREEWNNCFNPSAPMARRSLADELDGLTRLVKLLEGIMLPLDNTSDLGVC